MAKVIRGVPETITREQYRALGRAPGERDATEREQYLADLTAAGFDPWLLADRKIEQGVDGVYVTVVEPDPEWDGSGECAPGIPEWTPGGPSPEVSGVALHTIYIPVKG